MQDKFWNSKETVSDFFNKPCSKYITDVIDDVCNKDSVITAIDIGCGGGRYSRYLTQKNINATAVDKNLEMVNAVKLCNINSMQCSMDKLKFSDCQFDLALSIGVLHNATTILEFKQAVREMYRVLKHDKTALVSVFTNMVIDDDLLYQGKNCYTLKNQKPPMVLLARKEILDIFKKVGFTLVKIIDEHITDVGTGKRNVLSLCFKK